MNYNFYLTISSPHSAPTHFSSPSHTCKYFPIIAIHSPVTSCPFAQLISHLTFPNHSFIIWLLLYTNQNYCNMHPFPSQTSYIFWPWAPRVWHYPPYTQKYEQYLLDTIKKRDQQKLRNEMRQSNKIMVYSPQHKLYNW